MTATRPYDVGFTKIDGATEVHIGRGEIVVIGTPPAGDEETGHNCDAMGCGWCHVLFRASLTPPPPNARAPG